MATTIASAPSDIHTEPNAEPQLQSTSEPRSDTTVETSSDDPQHRGAYRMPNFELDTPISRLSLFRQLTLLRAKNKLVQNDPNCDADIKTALDQLTTQLLAIAQNFGNMVLAPRLGEEPTERWGGGDKQLSGKIRSVFQILTGLLFKGTEKDLTKMIGEREVSKYQFEPSPSEATVASIQKPGLRTAMLELATVTAKDATAFQVYRAIRHRLQGIWGKEGVSLIEIGEDGSVECYISRKSSHKISSYEIDELHKMCVEMTAIIDDLGKKFFDAWRANPPRTPATQHPAPFVQSGVPYMQHPAPFVQSGVPYMQQPAVPFVQQMQMFQMQQMWQQQMQQMQQMQRQMQQMLHSSANSMAPSPLPTEASHDAEATN